MDQTINKSFAFIIANNAIGQAIGMGAVTSDGLIDAQLRDIVVLPKYRKQGIGGNIVSYLVEYCHGQGIMHVGLLCGPHNVEFYKKQGFVVV